MMRKRLSTLFLGALSLSTLVLSACASDSGVSGLREAAPGAGFEGPIDPPPSFSSHAYWNVYHLARAGDCAGFEAQLSEAHAAAPDFMRPSRHALIGLLYDTGLCRPFNPHRAYEEFAAARDEDGRMIFLIVAWKEWFGHGVATDRERSYERTRDWLLYALRILSLPIPAWAEEAVLFRPAYPPLAEGVRWAERLRTGPPDRLSAFAIALMEGRAKDWNDRPIPRAETLGREMLGALALEYPRAKLDFAKAVLDGRLAHMSSISELDVVLALARAARACIDEAFTTFIAYYERKEGWRASRDAYRWALRAERAGFIEPQRREALGAALSASEREDLKAYIEAEPHYVC